MTDNRQDSDDDDAGKPKTGGENAGEDEGGSANEGREDHLKEDQKTTPR